MWAARAAASRRSQRAAVRSPAGIRGAPARRAADRPISEGSRSSGCSARWPRGGAEAERSAAGIRREGGAFGLSTTPSTPSTPSTTCTWRLGAQRYIACADPTPRVGSAPSESCCPVGVPRASRYGPSPRGWRAPDARSSIRHLLTRLWSAARRLRRRRWVLSRGLRGRRRLFRPRLRRRRDPPGRLPRRRGADRGRAIRRRRRHLLPPLTAPLLPPCAAARPRIGSRQRARRPAIPVVPLASRPIRIDHARQAGSAPRSPAARDTRCGADPLHTEPRAVCGVPRARGRELRSSAAPSREACPARTTAALRGRSSASGDRLAFGSTTGSLWVTEDQGDSWQAISTHLPPIDCVRFMA
ncbi:uncharacterized protein SOCEGT47_017030 [Sorangium cellulosum]|uniref:Uncharacterized protein n=1 Tax=Sorangium cellulosum TaxID=56 RepID=A0A4P2PXK3_SORCE|nr:uncharacterized protein SOCEGT47_017030 [Sorangium cellulosum]